MKIRTGFVSNSSSSSFIVSAENVNDVFVNLRISIKDMVDKTATTVEELDNIIKYEECSEEQYSQMVSEIEAGKMVLFCSADDSNGGKEAVICYDGFTMEETEGVSKIIQESAGY